MHRSGVLASAVAAARGARGVQEAGTNKDLSAFLSKIISDTKSSYLRLSFSMNAYSAQSWLRIGLQSLCSVTFAPQSEADVHPLLKLLYFYLDGRS